MTHSIEQVQRALETLEAQLAEATSAFENEANALRSKITKLHGWLWANKEHTADEVAAEYVALRDKRSALKDSYEEQDDVLKQQMAAREIWFLEQLNAIGASSIRTPAGTAYIEEKVRSSCADWPLFWNHIKETGRFDLLEKRVAQKPMKDLLEAVKDGTETSLPPGINTFVERVVVIRRSS